MYINNSKNGFSSSAKLFADDTLLSSVDFKVDASTKELNDDLAKIQGHYRGKMSLNSDNSKQVPGVIFSRKLKKLHILP